MVYYFYKKLTLTAKSNKNGKKDFKGSILFSQGKSNSCGVLIAYFRTGTFTLKKQQTDKEGRISILDVSINDSEYILINLYNANPENDQIDVLSSLSKPLEDFDISLTKQLVMARDFNLFFNSKLEGQGRNPTLKKKSLAKLIELKETYDRCDIWRVRNTKSKRFTFTQKHYLGFIQRRLDYILISNTLQEFLTMTDILTLISTDHSPVLLSLSKEKITIRGTRFWKFNSSLTKDQNYKTEIKQLIRNFSNENEFLLNRQLKWEPLKYEVRKFTIKYTKHVSKEKRQLKTNLENQLKKTSRKVG